MQRFGQYTTDFVLSQLGDHEIVVEGYRVKMKSQKYKVFKKGLECAYCGLKGEVFFLERHDKDPQIAADIGHFNLYARVDDEWVLFTKDHIKPKSKGGSNRLSNLVTACQPCNEEKGDRT